MSLLFTIFVLVLSTHILSWIGHSAVVDLAYLFYRKFNPSSSAMYGDQINLKAKILTTKAELNQTSAQQEFAKWAKLRRAVDKGLSDLEKLNSQISADKSSFSRSLSTVLWVLTTGSQWWILWWYKYDAVFYLPPGWFGGPLGWVLCLPFAPAGSISCGAWQMACQKVITSGEKVAKELFSHWIQKSAEEEGSPSAAGSGYATPSETKETGHVKAKTS